MSYMDWTCVDKMFVYPERREVVLCIDLAPQWYRDDPPLERSLRAKLAYYLAFIRDRKVERYHPDAQGFTPWIEIGYEGTLQGEDLEIVTRLQQEVIAQGIDVRTASVERM
jgi:hypothetical protein